MNVQFKILVGPPELLATGLESTGISPQLWNLLVSFLMAPNEQVPTEILIDRLWGEDPPPKASSTIRSYIHSASTRCCPTYQAARSGSARHARGYLLGIDLHAVDVHQFRSLDAAG